MILWDVPNAKGKEEKWKELMLVEDTITWSAKHVQDAMGKEKLLEENVAHAVGLKLCLDPRILVWLLNLELLITILWNLSIWETKSWKELQEIFSSESYRFPIQDSPEEGISYILIFSYL